MDKISFDSEGLVVDWLSFNLEGLMDPGIIANRLSKSEVKELLNKMENNK